MAFIFVYRCPPVERQGNRGTSNRAARLDIERIERMAACHEQPVLLAPAEGEIGAAFGQADEADRLALRVEHHHAVEVFRLGRGRAVAAPATPEISLGIDAEAVERAGSIGV